MWALIVVTMIFNPNIPHTHYEKRVDKTYYRSEEECLQNRDIFVNFAQDNDNLEGNTQIGCRFEKNAKRL